MVNKVVSKIWFGMSATNIHLYGFQIQGHLQKRGLMQMKNRLKLITIRQKTNLESTFLDVIIRYALMVYFNIKTQNLVLVNLKCVTYAQSISLTS